MKGLPKPKHAALNHEIEKSCAWQLLPPVCPHHNGMSILKKSLKCDQLAKDNCQ
jgi:hypothetical protein